jgi:HEAT repeat protein
MSHVRLALALSGLLFAGQALAAPPPAAAALSPDEQALQAAHLSTQGPALLDFFRKRSLVTAPRDELARLLQQLGAREAETHQKAFGELVSLGTLALPGLRQLANDVEDPDTAGRARRCAMLIEGMPAPAGTGGGPYLYGQTLYATNSTTPTATVSGAGIPMAAARLVAQLKPAGATEVLLAHLPFANDDAVAREVENTLGIVGFRDRKPDPALLKALASPLPLLRGVAATLLCRFGGTEQKGAVRSLLKDPMPSVRLRAAQALADLHEADAIPVLIGLLNDLPPAPRQQAQDYLSRLGGEYGLRTAPGADALSQQLRRDLWSAWWRNIDGAALVQELRRRTPSDANHERVRGLIRQLGDDAYTVREKAAAELANLGLLAIPQLHQAVHDKDARISLSASRCLQRFDATAVTPLPAALVRLLMLRKPEGAAEALLAYLPFAENHAVLSQVQSALGVVAVHNGQPDPALVRTLDDRVAQRRVAAAEVLCRVAMPAQQQAVRKLLQDPDPDVRLRVGLALVSAKDKEAIPVLIALLDQLAPSQAAQVEEFLVRLAGDQAPALRCEGDEAQRRKCREAWGGWWRAESGTVDLARIDNLAWLFGYALVIEPFWQRPYWQSTTPTTGRVLELDIHGKPCWQIDGLFNPVDAVTLPGERVVILEGNGRVTQRHVKGAIDWQLTLSQPRSCQRLENGNTLLVGQQQLLEVDRSGKKVFDYNRSVPDILAGRKLPDGQMILVTTSWMHVRLDATGKELRSTRLTNVQFSGGQVDVLPDGGLLLPQSHLNKVVECDAEGRVVADFSSVQQPNSAVRLVNGNTLIVSQYPSRIVELDRSGNVVWDCKENFHATRARR